MHRDDPIFGDPAGDAPPPVGAVGALDRFDVLTSHQRQQRHRLGGLRVEFGFGQVPEQPVGIADQRIGQDGAGLLVVPGDRRLTRIVVVVGGAVFGDHRGGSRHLPADPADRRDQLGDGVLGGDRVVEHGGVQRPAGLPGQRCGLRDHRLNRTEDPVRPVRGSQPPPPIGQRRRVERAGGDRQPARRLPPQVVGDRVHRLGVREPLQRLQQDHARHHIGRHARPAPPGPEQVGEHRIREQLPTVLGQEREHTARLQQMPGHRLHIKQLPLRIRSPLHPKIIPNSQGQQAKPRGLFRGLLAAGRGTRDAPSCRAACPRM
jgi:hypothetical protein